MRALEYPDPPLSDGIVAPRPCTNADIAALVEACQDPEIPRWTLVPRNDSEDDARGFLRRIDELRAARARMSDVYFARPRG